MLKRIAIWFLVSLWMLEELLWDAINWIEERIAFLHLAAMFHRPPEIEVCSGDVG